MGVMPQDTRAQRAAVMAALALFPGLAAVAVGRGLTSPATGTAVDVILAVALAVYIVVTGALAMKAYGILSEPLTTPDRSPQ